MPSINGDRTDRTVIDWPTILRTHGDAVWRTVYRMVGNAEAARDCYQETLLAALQTARKQRVENWGGLLQTLATRRALDCLRQRYLGRTRLHLADDLDDVVEPIEPVPARLEKTELCERVRHLLSNLPPRQAQAFAVYRDSQKKMADAARAAGATILMSNHTEFDRAYDRVRLAQLPRATGEKHPYESDAATVQRYFEMTGNCAEAQRLLTN